MRAVSRGWQVRGHPHRLRVVPSGELPGHEESQPRGGRLPHEVRLLPQRERLAPRVLHRPQQDPVPPHGGAPEGGLHALPRGRQVHGHLHRLRLVPPGQLPGHQEPQPRGGRVPDHLRVLPHHGSLAARLLRSRPDPVPPGGGAPEGRLRSLPRGRQVHGHAHRLRRLPPGELPGGQGPQPRRGRIPHQVRLLPQRQRLAARLLHRPWQDPIPPHGCSPARELHPVPCGRQVHGHAHRLLRLPPDRVPGHEDSEPRGGRIPHDLRDLPRHQRLASRHLRSRPDPVPPGGGAPEGRLRALPRGRQVHGHAHGLRGLPPGELPGGQGPQPRDGGIPHQVRLLPQRQRLAARVLHRPQQDPIPPHGCSPARELHPVPCGRQVHGHAYRLLLVPQDELSGHQEPEPRGGRLPHDVRDLPQRQRLDSGHVRSRQDPVPSRRSPPEGGLRSLPRGREVRGDAHRLLLLPPGQLPGREGPQPRHGGIPHQVRLLPQRQRLAACVLHRPQQDPIPPHGRPPAGELRPVSRGGQVHGHAHGLRRAATRPSTRPPRTRTTSRPASRPPASPATQRTPGLRPRSITARPGSRSPAGTRRWPVPAATSAGSTRGHPPTASPATRRTIRPPRTRTTWRPPSRRRARPATTSTAGLRPRSITARPGSLSPEPTRRWTALVATSAASTRGRPPTASPATRPTTRP